jgi:hypothetical protein
MNSRQLIILAAGAFGLLFVYVLFKVFIDMDARLTKLNGAVEGLLCISACRCEKAGTCAHCRATKVIEQERHIAYLHRKHERENEELF